MTPHSYSLAEATAELRRQQEQLQAASTRLREISTKSMAFGEAGDTAQRINENLQDGLEVLNVGNDEYGAALTRPSCPRLPRPASCCCWDSRAA
jgi:hypothetical protein